MVWFDITLCFDQNSSFCIDTLSLTMKKQVLHEIEPFIRPTESLMHWIPRKDLINKHFQQLLNQRMSTYEQKLSELGSNSLP